MVTQRTHEHNRYAGVQEVGDGEPRQEAKLVQMMKEPGIQLNIKKFEALGWAGIGVHADRSTHRAKTSTVRRKSFHRGGHGDHGELFVFSLRELLFL